MGNDIKSIVDVGISAQEHLRRNNEKLALLYIEFGYKGCEAGKNLEQVIMDYRSIRNDR